MDTAPKILLLDDDPAHLLDLANTLIRAGFEPLVCQDVSAAVAALADNPVMAIVDLFLDGDEGAHLSNDFINEHLAPAGIPYARMTSAPSLVPEQFKGAWVLHKRDFRSAPERLSQMVLDAID